MIFLKKDEVMKTVRKALYCSVLACSCASPISAHSIDLRTVFNLTLSLAWLALATEKIVETRGGKKIFGHDVGKWLASAAYLLLGLKFLPIEFK